MPLYFFLLDPQIYTRQLSPALAASWQQRSFAPCLPLCHRLGSAAETYAETCGLDVRDFLLGKVQSGLAFDRRLWRTLVGEVLLLAAVEMPEIETSPETLVFLLTGKPFDQARPCEQRTPIEQVHFGSRELMFGGGFYRPEHAGYNDGEDVARLAAYLAAVDSSKWRSADLEGLAELQDAAEREEELEYLRERFAELPALYQRARAKEQMIVCEMM